MHYVDAWQISELLESYIVGLEVRPEVFEQLKTYLDLLVRWNAKTNLTSIREPDEMVARHFGESLFAAKVLLEHGGVKPSATLADLGSGAGFPGLPIKLVLPQLQVTLIESQNKKATFLKEVARQLKLDGVEVFSGRAEQWSNTADIVTMRAVEKFEGMIPVARNLLSSGGCLCLITTENARESVIKLPGFAGWVGKPVPQSENSVVLVGNMA